MKASDVLGTFDPAVRARLQRALAFREHRREPALRRRCVLLPLAWDRRGRRRENGDVPPDEARPGLPLRACDPVRVRLARRRLRADRACPPLPATGPYEIAVETPNSDTKRVRLIRNRYFKVWSDEAKPDGYPDVIDVRWATDADGGADRSRPRPHRRRNRPDRGIREATSHRPSRDASTGNRLLAPRHANATVRRRPRAPRRQLRRRPRTGGTRCGARFRRSCSIGPMEAARPTCQVLPPSLPEYRPYCPFTLHPSGAGTWSAPDLAKARKLVRASGTAGAEVRVEVFARERRSTPETRLARSTLEPLGYRVSFVRAEPFSGRRHPASTREARAREAGRAAADHALRDWVDNGIDGYPSPFSVFLTVDVLTASALGMLEAARSSDPPHALARSTRSGRCREGLGSTSTATSPTSRRTCRCSRR